MVKFLKIRVFALFVLVLFLETSFAQTDCSPEFSPPKPEQFEYLQQTAKDHGFLWKVTKDGKASHLYGTIHVGKLEWMFPGPLVMNALEQSQKLVLELNLGDPDVVKTLMQLTVSKSDAKLSNELEERIKRLAIKNCVKYELLQNLRPEMQLMTLGVISLRREKIYPELGIDTTLREIAAAMKKTIIGIETPQEQMSLLLSKPEVLEQDIKEALIKIEEGLNVEILSKTVKSWVEKDFNVMDNYANWCKCLDTQKDRDEMKRALDDRNIIMVDRFDKIQATNGTVFMAVGALHMVGPMGIPALLKNQGYTVERLH